MVGAQLEGKSELLIQLKLTNGQLIQNTNFLVATCVVIKEGSEFRERSLQNLEQCGQGKVYCLYGQNRAVSHFFHLQLTDSFESRYNREILRKPKVVLSFKGQILLLGSRLGARILFRTRKEEYHLLM